MQSISNDRSLILFQTIDIFRLDNTKILKYIFFGNYKFRTIVLVFRSTGLIQLNGKIGVKLIDLFTPMTHFIPPENDVFRGYRKGTMA